jgi:hypothetical protein
MTPVVDPRVQASEGLRLVSGTDRTIRSTIDRVISTAFNVEICWMRSWCASVKSSVWVAVNDSNVASGAWASDRGQAYDAVMWGHRRPAWSTLVAAGLMGLVSLGFAGYALIVLSETNGGPVGSRDAVLLGLSGREESTATTIVVIVILVVSALTLGLTIGVLRRREGARHAALMTFGLLALLALAASLPGLMAVPPRSGARFGVLVGLADVAVVGLLLLPMTADDVEDAERTRGRAALRR